MTQKTANFNLSKPGQYGYMTGVIRIGILLHLVTNPINNLPYQHCLVTASTYNSYCSNLVIKCLSGWCQIALLHT